MRHASFVSVLAFRCAWHVRARRDMACAAALKAYQNINPHDRHASDKVVAAIVEALTLHPHWLNAES